MKQKIVNAFQEINKEKEFSGVFSVTDQSGILVNETCGFRNKSEELTNNYDTAFAIASGTKFFTGLAVCKLIEEGRLSLEDKLGELLTYDLKRINKNITVKQLLTHTSGVGDYIDEQSSSCMEDMITLYNTYPVYLWDNLSYYLQMFDELPEKFPPGERFAYSNTGFVLLGLVVESVVKIPFQQYVTDTIIKPCGLKHTNFYRMDRLPANTALGYCYDKTKEEWYTNMFCMPAIGGSDGGLYTCAADLDILWRKLMNHQILSAAMMEEFLKIQTVINEKNHRYYNLGMYQYKNEEKTVYYAIGGDFGVDFFTAYFPDQDLVVSALGNTEFNTWPLFMKMIEIL